MPVKALVPAALAILVGAVAITAYRLPSEPAPVEQPFSAGAFQERLDKRQASTLAAILPLPHGVDADRRMVELGSRLFHDPGLSSDGSVSCATCHPLELGGADGLPRSLGVDSRRGARNSPSVLNAALNFRQFWDGRSGTLEEQVGGPLTAHAEMANTWDEVVRHLQSDAHYVAGFAEIWDDGITIANIESAIAEFERTLITPGSRFDRYLEGELDVITPLELSGYQNFVTIGCISCHQGVNVGGNLYQRLGIASNFFEDRGSTSKSDRGRFELTGRDEDLFKFKVPGLRNVTRTAPYFHDGSIPSLVQAIRIMGRYQLGVELAETEVISIEAFLHTLEGPLLD